MPINARQALRLTLFLFTGIVLFLGIFTLGAGLDLNWGSIHISHHSAGRLLGFFFVAIAALFAAKPSFRNGILEAAIYYDKQPARSHRRLEWVVLGGIALWLGFLKIWQLRHLQVGCWDLGIYLNTMWHINHGEGFYCSFRQMNFLGDHFNPILALLAVPLRFGDWPAWPLLAQAAAMVGAIAVALELARKEHPLAASERLLLAFFFTLNIYFQTVHAFDMHPIAFAPLAVITAYLLGKRNRWWAYYLLLPFFLFGIQEDVPLVFLGLSLAWFADRPRRLHSVITAVLSIVAFWFMVHEWIPSIGGPTVYTTRYQTMGGSIDQIARTLVTHPWVPLKIFFIQGHIWPLLRIFASFGFLPFGSGALLLGLLPPVMQQSLCDYDGQYGYGYHYSSNVLGFLMIGTVAALSRHKIRREWLYPAAALLMAWFGFRAPAYMPRRDPALVKAVHELAEVTPPTTIVSAQNLLGVPFALRKKVYRFPDVVDAQLIILSRAEGPWPLTREEFEARVQALEKDPVWVRIEHPTLLLYRRK